MRSPLPRPLSTYLLLLTYSGHKCGRCYHLPCGYRREGSTVTLVAGNPWWKNLRGRARVVLSIAGEELRGVAVPVEDKAIAAAELMALLRKMPHLAKMYHAVLTPEGQPDPVWVKAAVDVQGDRDIGVAEHLADHFRVDVATQEQRGCGAAQIVKPHVGQPGPAQRRL
ncbi:MAG TPA: nitroreductase/quinone reductase family protein [Ktedonobacterales bacterium]|nr:nitroreductase/quinone reductase family protein [Ktedonobacterales bacterium]